MSLKWRPEFAVPPQSRLLPTVITKPTPREAATPESITKLLIALSEGHTRSPESAEFRLRSMRDTTTFHDLLKAGLRPGWAFRPQEGTRSSWNGVTAAVNDVGILFGPKCKHIAITALIGDSTAPLADRAKVMARIAPLATTP